MMDCTQGGQGSWGGTEGSDSSHGCGGGRAKPAQDAGGEAGLGEGNERGFGCVEFEPLFETLG